MTEYSLIEKKNGTIEFWTNDEDLRLRVSQNIADIADAIAYRRQIMRVVRSAQAESEDKQEPNLDKIRAEIDAQIDMYDTPFEIDSGMDVSFCKGLNKAKEIIDKYKASYVPDINVGKMEAENENTGRD